MISSVRQSMVPCTTLGSAPRMIMPRDSRAPNKSLRAIGRPLSRISSLTLPATSSFDGLPLVRAERVAGGAGSCLSGATAAAPSLPANSCPREIQSSSMTMSHLSSSIRCASELISAASESRLHSAFSRSSSVTAVPPMFRQINMYVGNFQSDVSPHHHPSHYPPPAPRKRCSMWSSAMAGVP